MLRQRWGDVDDLRSPNSESLMKFIQMPSDPKSDVTSCMLNCTGYVTTCPLQIYLKISGICS